MANLLQRLCLGLMGLMLSAMAQAEPLRIRADIWCPYNCQPGSDTPGYMIEVAAQVFADSGGVDYQLLPWTRALEALQAGQIQAVAGAASPEGEGLVFGTQPLGNNINVVITRRGDSWRYAGIASLADRRLAAASDYTYNPEIDAYIARHADDVGKVDLLGGADVAARNLRKLLAGRVDVMIEDRNVALSTLAAQQVRELVELQEIDSGTPLFIAFSPADPDAKAKADRLDNGIIALRKSGELARILARYGLRDWEATN